MFPEKITRRNLPHWYRPDAAHFVTYRLAGTIPLSVLRKLKNQRETQRRQGPQHGESLEKHRDRIHKQFFAQYDRYLDSHHQIDWLSRPDVAAKIRDNLYFHDRSKYYLLSYCVMPNHVHVLLLPIARSDKQPCLSNSRSDKQPCLSNSRSDKQPCLSNSPLAPTTVALSDVKNRDHKLAACGYDQRPFFSDEVPDRKSPLSQIMHSLKSYTANEANKLLSRTGQFWQHESYDHWVRDDDELERIIEYIAMNPVNAGLAENAQDWPCCSLYDRFAKDGVESALLCPEVVM